MSRLRKFARRGYNSTLLLSCEEDQRPLQWITASRYIEYVLKSWYYQVSLLTVGCLHVGSWLVSLPWHAVKATIMARALICLLPLVTIFLSGMSVFGDEPQVEKPGAKGRELFEKTIKPVLIKHCYECHSKNGKDIEGGLELDSPSGMMKGGDTGPMLVPHQVEKSPLLRMLRHADDASAMPPEEKLSDEIIAAFEEWIRLGAPDSRKKAAPTEKEQRLEAGKKHWAFQPPQAVEPPQVKLTDWPRDAMIDRFVLSAIEVHGLKPVGDANRRTLVRRVYFDLVGLPPSPEEVSAFMADESPDALAKLIDRLLDSPRFGERWGRHWLDVVRFAESSGMEFNFSYPHAWPYRNYVIDALNQDKPYDLFLREQIAGDLMPSSPEESPEAAEARRIAPSMLAFGPKRHNSGGMGFRMDVVDDQINTVTRAMLAMTVSCARCHDHKFDPVPTADYYALAGIFLSTEPLYGTIKQKYSNNPTALLPIGPNAVALHKAAEDHEKKLQETEKTLAAKQEELKKATEAEKVATTKKAEVEKLIATTVAAQAEETAKPDETAKSDKTEKPDEAAKPDAAAAETPAKPMPQEELKAVVAQLQEATEAIASLKAAMPPLEAQVADLKKSRPARPQYAMTVRDRAKPADTTIAVRGNFSEKGAVVPRGFLSVVQIENPPKITADHSGRLELAGWIASPNNPLTARVMVNRIWHHLFGRGLVPTVDNFGVIGKQPSHPKLLDALALRFTNDGWSVKRMIRAMMLSRAYQLSSTPNAANLKVDPGNRLLWRATPRRLEAETIRDAVLAVSGQLQLERPVGSTVTPLGDKLVRGIPTEKIQPPSNHRSVYLPIVRDYVPELFDLFDFPSPSLVSGRRSVTNVPSQALYLRNSKFIAEQAKHAAKRLLASPQATDDAARADLSMQWALARSPSDAENAGAMKLIEQVRQTNSENEDRDVNAWAAWFQTLFMTAEFRFLVDAN